MKSRLLVLIALALALAVAAVTGAAAGSRGGGHGHDAALDLPDRLDLPDGWQPEGITAGRRSTLYVGSIPTGAVLRLDARTGATRTVVPPQQGRAAIGLKYDPAARRLFVAGGPTGKAFVYSARDGADLGELQLAPTGDTDTFVNDVALTRRTAYFTESRKSAVYAVDRDLGSSRTIALPDIPDEEGNNLNGIVAAGQGLLLAVQSNAGRLWRIDPASAGAVQVDLGGVPLTNGDGLLLKGRTLYVVQNRLNRVAVVRLNADYTAGKVVTTITPTEGTVDVPTTITFQLGELYAVNARFGTTAPQPADYWVTLVRR